LLEGALKIEDLVKRTKDLQMPAVAVTDTGNLFGALEFSEACIREGVKPILGVQLDVEYFDEKETTGSCANGSKQRDLQKPDQIILLAQNKSDIPIF